MTSGTTTTAEFDAFLAAQERKDQLRFVICGSVDDGKSTLLGRLLHDADQVREDQLSEVVTESRSCGTRAGAVDLALLVDGLQAEREQSITIDAAYRYFETGRRKFIAVDTPGHEQYTRNMATGASNADLAVILADARKGILPQTRRHAVIAALMGIRDTILAVNKMDLIGYSAETFRAIATEFAEFSERIGLRNAHSLPVSALEGENVHASRGLARWHDGRTLMELLESIDPNRAEPGAGFRLPVQRVNRPGPDFRGYSGTIASGTARRGMPAMSSLSGEKTTIQQILGPSGDLETASAGQAVTVVLADAIDLSRGDILADTGQRPTIADQFAADMVWLDSRPLLPERPYWIQIGRASATAQITDIVHRLDVDTLAHLAARKLEMNDVGYCKISLDRPVAFDPYLQNRHTGGFLLIDKSTNATAGVGMIRYGLRRASNLSWHAMRIDKPARARAKGQEPRILWLTGLSGAGKSTIANLLEQKLQAEGRHTYLLDGDNVRHGLSKDLGFTDADRVENIRRVAEVAKLMVDAGLIVIVAFISPFRSERTMARAMVERHEFIEIFVDAPLDVCEARDPKGLYKKARSGALPNFTGIDSDYEPPVNPEIVLKSAERSPGELVEQVAEYLDRIEEA